MTESLSDVCKAHSNQGETRGWLILFTIPLQESPYLFKSIEVSI